MDLGKVTLRITIFCIKLETGRQQARLITEVIMYLGRISPCSSCSVSTDPSMNSKTIQHDFITVLMLSRERDFFLTRQIKVTRKLMAIGRRVLIKNTKYSENRKI